MVIWDGFTGRLREVNGDYRSGGRTSLATPHDTVAYCELQGHVGGLDECDRQSAIGARAMNRRSRHGNNVSRSGCMDRPQLF